MLFGGEWVCLVPGPFLGYDWSQVISGGGYAWSQVPLAGEGGYVWGGWWGGYTRGGRYIRGEEWVNWGMGIPEGMVGNERTGAGIPEGLGVGIPPPRYGTWIPTPKY